MWAFGIEAGARGPERRGLRHAFEHLVEHRAVGIEPRSGNADLAGVEEDRARHARRGRGDIDIGHHHHRRLAAEFERDMLERVGGVAVDQLADLGRSGEGDLVDIGMLDHAVTGGVAVAGDDVEHARREARFGDQIGQLAAR